MSPFHRAAALSFALVLLAAAHAGDWPQFRGPQRDGIARESGLARSWPANGPKVVWSTEVCEGYAGAAIVGPRVYFEDYSKDAKEYLVRCLDFATGKELWRYKDAKTIRANHGITRTVVATDGQLVFALDPKCILHALDAETGREAWRKDLVEQYKAQIPPWYNGQCPLLDGDRLVIGVGGEALLVALEKTTGNEVWKTPNAGKWPLAHSSVMPATLGGVKQYLWCTLAGPLGVSAADGKLLWHQPRKFNIAVAPSPLAVGDDRVFMTSCYDAGTIYLRLKKDADAFKPEVLFDWAGDVWNAEVHTPILWREHLYAVGKEKRGLLTCLDLDGQRLWTSADKASFDLGGFLLAAPANGDGPGLLYVLDGKSGVLKLVEPNPGEYKELGSAQLLAPGDVWAPPALSNGRLIIRDMAKMICVDVKSSE